MKIAIIGAGHVGGNLGRALGEHGHDIVFGVRDPSQYAELAAEMPGKTRVEQPGKAAAFGQIIVLAVPYHAVRDVVPELGELGDKILVDCTNPLDHERGPKVAQTREASGAETVAALADGGLVVKAFNTVGASYIVDPRQDQTPIDQYICGDHEQAKDVITALSRELGYDVVDCGPLHVASELEHMAALWIRLAYTQKMGGEVAFKLLRC
ncbi:MAG: NADPH-dependent F420 reductase [Myxococcota bacterium]